VVPSAPNAHGRTEGAPMSAREALAAGIPLIASATGGLVELAGPGTTLVQPGDPHALAAALDTLAPAVAPRPDLGWRCVGSSLDRHWNRAHRYAPDAAGAHDRSPQWSSRPSAPADSSSDSRALSVTQT
jgi:glycosyltransferase involved in cell wall biosynthesis